MFTKTIANKISIQLKEITKHTIYLFNEKGILLTSTQKNVEKENSNEKQSLYFSHYHFGFFTIKEEIDAQTFQLIKALIEMSYGQQLLLNEKTFSNKTIETFIETMESNTLSYEIVKKLELRLGLLFSPPYQMVVGEIQKDKVFVLQFITNFFKDIPVLIHFVNQSQFYIISFNSSSTYFSSKVKELANQLHTNQFSYKIGVSPSIISYHLLHKAWKEAMDSYHFSTDNLVFYSDILLESLIISSNEGKRADFMKGILKDLTDKYFETIENFCAYNLNIADCSKAMFIHRNSLIYRLKKIYEITGLDPMKANDLFLLKTALKIRKIDFH